MKDYTSRSPRIIRWPTLLEMFDGNISQGTILRWEKENAFPRRIKLGSNMVGWNLEAVEKWFFMRENPENE